MKSAQISQIFVYIMSGIIITAVLGFGVKMISDLIDTSNEIGCLRFKDNLHDIIQGDKDYGTVDNLNLKVDCDFRKICFINDPVKTDPPEHLNYPIIKNSWEGSVRQNVFFVNIVAEDFYYIPNLKVPTDIECFDVTSAGINILLKGKGKFTELSVPPSNPP